MTEHDYGQPPYPSWDEPDPDGAPDLDGASSAGAGTWTLDALAGDKPEPAAGFQQPGGDDGTFYPDRTSLLPRPSDSSPRAGQPVHDGEDAGSRRWRRHRAGSGPRRPSALRRLVITTLVLTGVAAIALTATGGNHPLSITPADNPAAASPAPATSAPAGTGTRPVTGDQPAISQSAARQVLDRFSQANNTANEQRSGPVLAAIEGGSSYAMDLASYQVQRVTNPAGTGYIPFTAANAVYYIPLLPAAMYPRWFAVRIAYTTIAAPQRVTGTGYIIFDQSQPGGPWLNVLEPYFLPGSAPAPFILTEHGYAETASPGSSTGLSTAPGQIAAATAASLDGQPSLVTSPPSLADQQALSYFRSRLPAGSTSTLRHFPAGSVFALKTVDGGVLAFYHLNARLSLAPPPGDTFEVGITGFLSSTRVLTTAEASYVDQFAAYIPPGSTRPQIIADASGIVSASGT